MHHDAIWLFTGFWWLIFPLFWMIAVMAAHWSRHARANRVLDLLKSYADQGKDPPPELLKTLQGPFGHLSDPDVRRQLRRRHRHGWRGVFLFTALAVGFAVMAWHPEESLKPHSMSLIFVAIVMAGLALGNLVAALTTRRDDDDQALPK